MSTGRDRIGSEARAFAGFLAGLPRLLRQRMSYEEARGIVLQRLRDREANFLSSMEHGVFGNPRSPYRALLELAGCEYGDLVRSVHDLGLEGTLRSLREAGVYVTFEEFKGRTPLVRGGRTIPIADGDFDNPRFRRYVAMSTSGSSGAPRRVLMDLSSMSARLPVKVLSVHYHGLVGTRWIRWADIPPGIGLTASLTDWVCGTVPERWFTAVWGGRDGTSSRFRAATIASLTVARLSGAKLPWPEYLPLDSAATIARLAGEILRRDGRCQVRAGVSRLLRVALAAKQEGIDLTGTVMHGGGEPPSAAKVAGITGSGARFLSSYHFTEAGAIGHGCTASDDPNDQHFQKDHLAMIQTRRTVPGFDVEVGVLAFTSLLPSATKLLLNVESDDYAVVETRPCGCPWGELGLTDHISDIRSFGKLTGEGVTLVGSDVERILEEVLPARFGGSPLDYQLVEEEDERGFTRLILRVSPSVALADEAAPAELVYQALRAEGAGGATSVSKWKQAGTLSVRREAPRPTARGKLLPLQLLKTTRPAAPVGR